MNSKYLRVGAVLAAIAAAAHLVGMMAVLYLNPGSHLTNVGWWFVYGDVVVLAVGLVVWYALHREPKPTPRVVHDHEEPKQVP